VRYSAAYVAKIEQGKRFPPADLPARAEEVLGPVALKVLTAAARSLTRRAGLASWFRQWAGIEEETTFSALGSGTTWRSRSCRFGKKNTVALRDRCTLPRHQLTSGSATRRGSDQAICSLLRTT
jgi:hypothetical protein